MLFPLLTACVHPPAPTAAAAAPPAVPVERPRLVVEIVVDQLPVRLLAAVSGRVDGGFARLLGADAFVGEALYPHAITHTCPGHAAISTGGSPDVTGVIANEWWKAGMPPDKRVFCSEPGLLRVPGVADAVLAAGGTAVAVSLKERSARMLAGQGATAIWFDGKAFTGPFASLALPARTVWEPLDRAFLEARMADAGPHEPPKDATFPHPAETPFLRSPDAGVALTEVALSALTSMSLGDDEVPDLLAVSYSQTDYIGHTWTAESWEALDGMLRLDRELGRLFAALDAEVGAGKWAAVLTSDHGSARPSPIRVPPDAVPKAANAALAAAGVNGVAVFEDPSLWLPAGLSPELRDRVAAAVSAVPGVGGVWTTRPLAGPARWREEVARSIDAERSGDLYVLLGEGGVLYAYDGQATGTSHGTPYDEDVRVPLLAVGKGIRPAAWGGQHDIRSVAPTVAALLGVPAPTGATSPPVDSMFAR